MSAERNSSLAIVLCLPVGFEFIKRFKKNGENVGLWNVSVSVERVRLLRILATDLQSDFAHSQVAFVLRMRCVLQSVMFC